jgi:hypothetical protein
MRTRHKDLVPGMSILTPTGWRTVTSTPVPWLGGALLVHLSNNKTEVQDPDFVWVRRINTLNAKERP